MMPSLSRAQDAGPTTQNPSQSYIVYAARRCDLPNPLSHTSEQEQGYNGTESSRLPRFHMLDLPV